jgi:hypothetical protein
VTEDFPAIEVYDRDVIAVLLEPPLVTGRGDVHDFQLEGRSPAHALDDIQSTAAK